MEERDDFRCYSGMFATNKYGIILAKELKAKIYISVYFYEAQKK
jgi:hypothetical protein